MPTEITMPQQSDTMTEGTVVRWLKKEGDKVKEGDVIAEIETDKAVMEMEAYDSGTLAAILAAEGQKVPVGAAIAVLATGKDNVAEIKKRHAGGSATAAAPVAAESRPAKAPVAQNSPASPAGGGAVATLEAASVSEVHEPDDVGHGATRSAPTAVPPLSHGDAGNGGRVLVSPLARRIALDKGIDLRQLRGSGPAGRIVQSDVLAFVEKGHSPVAARTPPVGGLSAPVSRETRLVPLTKMRAAIATALQRSKQQLPHFYETIDIDGEEISGLRARLNEQLKSQNVKLSLADFISKAVASALLRHSAVNATFDGATITRHADVHLGIAVAVPDGLIVPVLKHADQMGLRELRERTVSLIERARAGRQKQDEMSGGTFTISSLGSYGIREFSAIINPPQVAILAVGAAEKRAVVRAGQIVPRTMMTVTLSADHRVVDGATAAEFLQTLKALLEEPAMMLL